MCITLEIVKPFSIYKNYSLYKTIAYEVFLKNIVTCPVDNFMDKSSEAMWTVVSGASQNILCDKYYCINFVLICCTCDVQRL